MKITASGLRQDVYRILDRILTTGVPVEIVRRGRTLRIVPAEPVGKLDRLERRDYLAVDPGEIVHVDWSGEWKP